MILTSSESVIPCEITETLGLVRGSAVMSKHIGQDLLASLQTLVGGEIEGYHQMIDESRKLAEERMIREGEALGADAIISIRYASSSVMQGAAEMLVYGTAVKLNRQTVENLNRQVNHV